MAVSKAPVEGHSGGGGQPGRQSRARAHMASSKEISETCAMAVASGTV